jgi:hypothetical protein
MKPLKHLILLTTLLFLFSCQKEPVPKPLPEAGYPKTYTPLSASEWNQRNSEFQEINIYEGLSLNKYGFVEGEIRINENDSLTQEFVVNKLDSIINTYKSYLGITININIENDIRTYYPLLVGGSSSISLKSFYEDLNTLKNKEYWTEIKDFYDVQRFFITQSKIGNNNFLGPTLYFIFNEPDKTIEISGKWLPDVFLPKNEIYTLDEAITKTYRFVLKETGIDLWESKNTFENTKTFIFLEKENEITIHECWRCIVPLTEFGYYYYISIDTQTGEIIHTYKKGIYYM